jgi:predicted nucleic acid-binding protein
MTEPAFLDTNILCYTKDSSNAVKHLTATKLVEDLITKKLARVSTQVVNEFYVFLKRHSKDDAERLAAKLTAQSLLHLAPVAVSSELLSSAWHIEEKYKLSWWDSLVVAAALTAGCKTLYTEDLQHNQQIGSLQIINPFV